MKKLIYLGLFSLLILNFIGCTSNKRYDIKLIPFQEKSGGDWGFIDTKGKVVIEPDFEMKPSVFSEGMAFVLDDEEFKFIKKNGEMLDEEFKDVTMFSEGLACVVKEDEYPTYINKRMKVVFEAPYIRAGIFREGLAKVCNADNKWGYINKKGKIVIDPIYSNATCFYEGYAVVYDEDGKCGIIDKKGKTLKEFKDSVIYSSFSDGLAYYYDMTTEEQGYINKKGEVAIEGDEDYDYYPFVNGYASFRDDDGEFGVIDKKGKEVIKSKFEDIPLYFFNGLAVYSDDNEYGFVDIKGKKVIKADFDNIGIPFLGSNAIVRDGKKYRVIDKKGDKVDSDKIKNVDGYIISSLYSRNYPCIYNYEGVVESDYFDITLLLNDIFVKDLASIKGVTTETAISEILETFDLSESDLEYNTTTLVESRNALSSGMSYNINVTLEFYKKIQKQKGKYTLDTYYNSYEGGTSGYYRLNTSENELDKSNVLKSVIFDVTLEKDKTDEVLDSLVERLVKAGYDKPEIGKTEKTKKKKKTNVSAVVDDPYAVEDMSVEVVAGSDSDLKEVTLNKDGQKAGILQYNVKSNRITITYYLKDSKSDILISEDFEDKELAKGIQTVYVGKFNTAPGIVESEDIKGKANYSFGQSACSYSCSGYGSDLVITFEKPVYVSTLQLKELFSSSSYYSYNKLNANVYVNGKPLDVNLAEGSSNYYSYNTSKSKVEDQTIGIFEMTDEIVIACTNVSDDDKYNIDDVVVKGSKTKTGKKAATDSLFFGLNKMTSFTGTIGTSKINGRIVRSGYSLSGYYIYEGSNAKISVQGNVDDSNKTFYLRGVNEKARSADELKGSYTNGLKAEGTYKNLINRKTNNFTLSAN